MAMPTSFIPDAQPATMPKSFVPDATPAPAEQPGVIDMIRSGDTAGLKDRFLHGEKGIPQNPIVEAVQGGMPLSRAVGDYVLRGVDPGTNKPNVVQSALRGFSQGGTRGWSDEGAAALDTAKKWALNKLSGTQSDPVGTTYATTLADIRAKNADAQAANPGAYGVGEFTGAMATPTPGYSQIDKIGTVLGSRALGAASRVAAKTALGAGEGALFGAGLADHDKAWAAGKGALIGAGLGLGGAAVEEGVRGVRQVAQGRQNAAADKAAQQAEKESGEKIAHASGAYGGEMQKGSRQLENITREWPNMTPEERQIAADLLASGDVDALRRQVISSTLEKVPGQASTIAQKKQEMLDLIAGKDEAVKARTEELLKPTFGEDAKTLFKQYGEPAVGSALGSALGYVGGEYVLPELGMDPHGTAGGALGGTLGGIGGLMSGRTRAGKAIMFRLNRPGNAQAIWGGIERALPESIPNLSRLAPAAENAVTGAGQDGADHFKRWMTDPNYRRSQGGSP